VQRGAGLGVGQADPEYPLDEREPLVERGPCQVRTGGGEGLVAAGIQEDGQVGGQAGAVLGVVGQQRSELTAGERAKPVVVPQQVQQTAQPQVG
jgi:hypothetical protein